MPYEPMSRHEQDAYRDRDHAMQLLAVLAVRNGGEIAFTDEDMEAARDGAFDVSVMEDPAYHRTVVRAVKR